MRWRRIQEEEVFSAIADPDKLGDSIKGRKNAFKRIGDRMLKVTYKHEGDEYIVITALAKEERTHEDRI